MKASFLLSLLVFISTTHHCFSQIEAPARRVFNIGTFVGIGGTSVMPVPTLDVRYRGTTLRVAPGYRYNGIGLIQEIRPVSRTFYNAYWIVSAFYYAGNQDIHNGVKTDYTSAALLGGIKYYMGTHFFTELQLGTVYTDKTTVGFEDNDGFAPYFEFGIGFNLFRNYPKKVIEEDE